MDAWQHVRKVFLFSEDRKCHVETLMDGSQHVRTVLSGSTAKGALFLVLMPNFSHSHTALTMSQSCRLMCLISGFCSDDIKGAGK
jgi:hypothetical protein